MIIDRILGHIISIFVNNLNIFALCRSSIISEIKNELAAILYIVDIRFFAFYIELEVTHDREKRTIKLFQSRYITKLLDC